jgi:hypothetical protein
MQKYNLKILEKDPCTIEIPELLLKVTFEIIDAEVVGIGESLNALNTILKVIENTKDPSKDYNGIPLNQIDEDKLDKVSKFIANKPARSRFEDDHGNILDVYAEAVIVMFTDKYVNALGFQHYNITTMSGAVFVSRN